MDQFYSIVKIIIFGLLTWGSGKYLFMSIGTLNVYF